MTEITTLHYLVVAASLFIIGTIGVLTRRNVIIILMSIELILNAVNLNLVAFSRLYGLHGQVFSIFVITDAAAEAAVGTGHHHRLLPQQGDGECGRSGFVEVVKRQLSVASGQLSVWPMCQQGSLRNGLRPESFVAVGVLRLRCAKAAHLRSG